MLCSVRKKNEREREREQESAKEASVVWAGRATYARIKSIQLAVAMKMLCIRSVLLLMETS